MHYAPMGGQQIYTFAHWKTSKQLANEVYFRITIEDKCLNYPIRCHKTTKFNQPLLLLCAVEIKASGCRFDKGQNSMCWMKKHKTPI